MLTQEQIVTIKVMKKQGHAIRAIARDTRIARNSVKKYLANKDPVPKQKRKKRQSKLDPFKTYIQSRIAAAAPDWIPATVLY